MSVSADGTLRKSFGLKQVPVANIEDTLRDTWRELARARSRPHVHSCALTLVACVEEEDDSRTVMDIVGELAHKHAMRGIALRACDSVPENSVSAWTAAGCCEDDDDSICSEEIVINANVHEPERLVSSARGLLVPDLPVMLWWRSGSPFGSMLFSELHRLCDRVIVDSVRFGDGAAALDTLRQLVQFRGGKTLVRDLNWQRTEPWRNAIAMCFDDPAALALLPHLDRCSVTFAGAAEPLAPSARSLMLVGWLTGRFPQLHMHCRTAPGKHWNDVASGRIVAVALTSSSQKASLIVVREKTALLAEAHDRGGQVLRRWTFPARTRTEAELLDRCIDISGRDSLFEAALKAD